MIDFFRIFYIQIDSFVQIDLYEQNEIFHKINRSEQFPMMKSRSLANGYSFSTDYSQSIIPDNKQFIVQSIFQIVVQIIVSL